MWSWRFSWMIERIEDSSNGIKTLENIISDRILPNKLPSSLLVPLVAAVWTFVESCHRLVSGSNLNLFEIGLVVFACCYVCAEDLRLINVLPGVVASQYIVDLLALEGDLVFKSLSVGGLPYCRSLECLKAECSCSYSQNVKLIKF